jgi:hypothetical protein
MIIKITVDEAVDIVLTCGGTVMDSARTEL